MTVSRPLLQVDFRPESPLDDEAIERLHDRAFGPGRYARTAFRLREVGANTGLPGPLSRFCFSALVGTLLVGSVRLTSVMAGPRKALVLGPLAVDPAFEGAGIGGALVGRALDAAREAGESLVLLVGDEPYYQRFGFKRVPAGQLELPGPVDPNRLLAVELVAGSLGDARGVVRPIR